MDDFYMNMAIKEAKKAIKNDEVPVGAIVVNFNKNVFTKGYNKKNSIKISTKHAEIIAIEKMCKKTNDWRLYDCVLYVTLEPCLMCVGAILESRIKKVVIGCKKSNLNDSYLNILVDNNVEVICISDNIECSQYLKSFFKNKRN